MAIVFDVADEETSVTPDGTTTPSVEAGVSLLREALASLEQTQHVTLSIVGLSRDDVERLSAGDPWWATVTRDAIPLDGPAPSALAARLKATRTLQNRA